MGPPAARRRKWSGRVTRTSNALDLEPDVFTLRDPAAVAASLRRSALRSTRRRAATAYQSAMSMLTFYINRAGRHLDAGQRHVLERAKGELRRLFARGPSPRPARPRRRPARRAAR